MTLSSMTLSSICNLLSKGYSAKNNSIKKSVTSKTIFQGGKWRDLRLMLTASRLVFSNKLGEKGSGVGVCTCLPVSRVWRARAEMQKTLGGGGRKSSGGGRRRRYSTSRFICIL
jgi:hypothetical protein